MGGQVTGRRRSLFEGPGAREARQRCCPPPLAASCSCLFVNPRAQGTWVRLFGGVACLCTPDLQICQIWAICPFFTNSPSPLKFVLLAVSLSERAFWKPSSFKTTHPPRPLSAFTALGARCVLCLFLSNELSDKLGASQTQRKQNSMEGNPFTRQLTPRKQWHGSGPASRPSRTWRGCSRGCTPAVPSTYVTHFLRHSGGRTSGAFVSP